MAHSPFKLSEMHHLTDGARLTDCVEPPQPCVSVAGVKRLEAVAQVPLACHLRQLTGQILRATNTTRPCWHTSDHVKLKRNMKAWLTTPPPKERSQFPISVLATMSGMVSGWDQPTASTAIAMWASGILSSLTLICCTSNQETLWYFALQYKDLLAKQGSLW